MGKESEIQKKKGKNEYSLKERKRKQTRKIKSRANNML